MKINLLAVGALAAMLATPLGANAQQQNPAPGTHARATTPGQASIQRRWAKRFGNLNLSGDQQQHIQSLINQYSQGHPEGSPRDPGASRELRHQIMGVLNDDQRNQFREQIRERRAQMQQRQGQMQQGQAPNGQYQQQGPPPDQQQGPPPGQQQGPPPGQQQGPPPGQPPA